MLEQLPPQMAGYGPLPGYNLAALADLEDGGDQIALVALVYDDEAEAQAAAAEMTRRIAAFSNPQSDDDTPYLENVEGVVDEPRVYHSESTDLYVAIAVARYPMPPSELVSMVDGEPVDEGNDEPTTCVSSGLLHRFWINTIFQRSFYPLVITG
jgi:hypothetical protein